MRASELAELTGTTVRTIRHYHAEGLLPIPDEGSTWRDYDLSHVARLSRIRWLVGAGLSLPQVREALTGTASPFDELAATLREIDAEINRLTDQRERLARLLDSVDSEPGSALTPMPPRIAAYYAHLEQAAPDEATRRAVVRERDFLELAYYRGEVPDEIEWLYAALEDTLTDEGIAAFTKHAQADTDEDIAVLADEFIARLRTRLGPRVRDLARVLDTQAVEHIYRLYSSVGDPRERRIGQAVQQRVLAALAEERERP